VRTGVGELLGSCKPQARGGARDDGHLLVRQLLCLVVGAGEGAGVIAAALCCTTGKVQSGNFAA
jgi:hypothetical protein